MSGRGIGGHILAFTGADGPPLTMALASLTAAGYRGVELMGLDVDPALPRAAGLAVVGCHGVPEHWDDTARVIARCRALGCTDLCSSGPLGWVKRDPSAWRATAATLNRAGRALRAAGIHLHYHNHAFEFDPLSGGRSGFDLLLPALDPEACDLCLDLGWVHRAGLDPVAMMRAHAARVGYLHLRDFAGERSVALGRGEVDLARQLAVLGELPACRAVVVEQDASPGDPAADMAASLDHLRTLADGLQAALP